MANSERVTPCPVSDRDWDMKKELEKWFVLSTQSFGWFHERGFKEVPVEDVPKSRQVLGDETRLAKMFHKLLFGSCAVTILLCHGSPLFIVFFLSSTSFNVLSLTFYSIQLHNLCITFSFAIELS